VINKELTSAAKRAIAENPDKLQTGSRNPFGARPELTDLINRSKFTPVLNSLIGSFDPPIKTHIGILPVASAPPGENDMPYFNAGVHMDGLITTGFINDKAPTAGTSSTAEYSARYVEMINANSDTRSEASLHRRGRHAMNIGTNGGMLFQDEGCSLSTGSFTLFAVACLNEQTVPGCGQFCVLRGCHHAMESFYKMQQQVGGIVGPEGPGWPRLGPMVPAAVREHFIDEHALPAPSGELFPRPTQCLMEEGDITITMHAIPHSGTRNEGSEPRANMIWRIRSKLRQPSFVADGATDHPDRWSRAEPNSDNVNGGFIAFDQHDGGFFPGEEGNDPFERSKYALSHIWHEWPGMADIAAEQKTEEARSGQHPRGAGPGAVDHYKEWVTAHPEVDHRIPTAPQEAREYWARYEREHPGAVITAEQPVALRLASSAKL
jgi:hypothetical protein